MNKSHNIQLGLAAQIFDKDGNLKEEKIFSYPNDAYKNSINIEVKDADNKIIEMQEIPFRSYTYNFETHFMLCGILGASLGGGSAYAPIDTSGVTGLANYTTGRSQYDIEIGANDATLGIVIGTGSLPVSASDYILAGQITHGVNHGQMYYGSSVGYVPVVSGSGWKTTMMRTFSNYSTASIDVKELGIIAPLSYYNGFSTSTTKNLIARDVNDVSGSALNITVPVSGTLTVLYNFEVNPECGLNKNWINWYYYDMVGSGGVLTNIINIVSSSGNISSAGGMFAMDTSTTGSIKGIVCGSGSGAVTLDDYNIGLIQNGLGAGELVYGAHAVVYHGVRSATTGSSEFSFRRPFTNGSGASVDINEVAIYASDDFTYPITNTDCWMYTRFVTSGITIEDGETAEFRFVYSFTFQ